MANALAPCPECRRHVRINDSCCPFCATALDAAQQNASVVPGATQRISRSAAIVFGTSIAIASCASSVTPGSDSATITDGNPAAHDARADAPRDDGGFAVLYGPAPFFDAGHD